jgi:hypothetical protein
MTPEEDARAWTVAEFRKWREEITAADEHQQLAFAVALAINWKFFIAAHESPTAFARLQRSEQMKFYEKWLGLTLLRPHDREATRAAQMLCYFLAAIINKDREFEVEAAQFLDAHCRKGWPIAVNIPYDPPPDM